ncbi:serine/threonine protein kinase [Trebonia kvetii]|uniref:non-specific serine/threonine protein kinase n=1 Tax=Trebonia kvetii TaxID=2480626 RepID=A0A6P2BQW6_9ACTN|nr:serine/threonine-protein kinase [Trebonia kvetii]TVZ00555.1 serine/threonine protein kinase [Trebonia kvetii]
MTPLRLGSRYQLEERMGEGGLGVVWRGSDIVTGAGFAIKLLRPEHARDEAAVARFMRERTVLLRFRHPNVVALHDMIVEGDRLALVMDLVADGDLAAHRQRCGGTLDPSEATELMAQVCNALATAHAAGIVHRDLKPANILLDSGRVRLTDFGIAQIAGEPSLTSEGVFLGTLHYLAPEVIQGDEPTPACDCYAVGVTLYELLAGDLPFTGQAAAVMHGHLYLTPERPEGIPDSSWRLIAACLDKDPRRRPNATELELALRTDPWRAISSVGGDTSDSLPWTDPAAVWEQENTGPGVLAADPVTVESRVPRRRRNRGRLAFGALAMLAAVAVIALAVSRSLGPAHPAAAPAVTVTEQVTPGGTVALGRIPGADLGGPSPQPGSTAPASTHPGTPPGHTLRPSPESTGATATSSAPPTTAPASPPVTATPPASGTPTATPTTPADTPWQCGTVAAATMSGSGKATGQTLQACIRIGDGKLDLRGTLNGTKAGWHEQIILVLEDSSQHNDGSYTSPVCIASACTFSTSLVPSSGEWTVLPEWAKAGNFQSSGNEPGYVDF